MKIFLTLLFIAISITIPFFYEGLLEFFVVNLKSGWVFGSIYIRLLVIITFTIFLYLFFSLFAKTKKIKFIFVLLIALLPGFGVSFIAPIYNTDYGMLDDPFQLDNIEKLEASTEGSFQFDQQKTVLAFFTTACPHCKMASNKLGINKKAGMNLNVHAFFPSTKEDAEKFLAENNGDTFNYHLIKTDEEFTAYAGYTFPSIFIVDAEGNTEKHWTGDVINFTALDYFADLEP